MKQEWTAYSSNYPLVNKKLKKIWQFLKIATLLDVIYWFPQGFGIKKSTISNIGRQKSQKLQNEPLPYNQVRYSGIFKQPKNQKV